MPARLVNAVALVGERYDVAVGGTQLGLRRTDLDHAADPSLVGLGTVGGLDVVHAGVDAVDDEMHAVAELVARQPLADQAADDRPALQPVAMDGVVAPGVRDALVG